MAEIPLCAMGGLGGLFGGGAKPPTPVPTIPAPVPEPIKPIPLPDPEDPAELAARRRQLLAAAGTSGRASTTLRTNEDYSTSRTGVA